MPCAHRNRNPRTREPNAGAGDDDCAVGKVVQGFPGEDDEIAMRAAFDFLSVVHGGAERNRDLALVTGDALEHHAFNGNAAEDVDAGHAPPLSVVADGTSRYPMDFAVCSIRTMNFCLSNSPSPASLRSVASRSFCVALRGTERSEQSDGVRWMSGLA
jgi:hypothetical protein